VRAWASTTSSVRPTRWAVARVKRAVWWSLASTDSGARA